MLAAIGTIKIGSHATTQTGSGSGTAIGNYELTATSQRIFHKLGVAYQYDDNIYIVNAKTLADNVIQIEIQYQDIHPNGAGVDPNITGTIVSAITQRRASGSSVTTPSPTYTNIVTF
jgi:hypothetical protein